MSLLFDWKEVKNRNRGLTFDDVLIVPAKSAVRSRRDPSLETKLTKNLKLSIPVISANMDTVTESAMAIAMNSLGGLGILHRFISIEDQVLQIKKVKESGANIISASIGVGDDFKSRAKALVEAGANVNARNADEQTPLHVACLAQSVETVELLIKTYPDGKVSGYMNALKVKICEKKF